MENSSQRCIQSSMHKDLKVWTILAPQENCQEGGVGSANYSKISKGDTDILTDGEFPFDRRLG